MPKYEYRCEKCDHQFEFLHLKKDDQAECPQCHAQKLQRLLSVVSGHVSRNSGPRPCPPSDAPPCNPNCCRLP